VKRDVQDDIEMQSEEDVEIEMLSKMHVQSERQTGRKVGIGASGRQGRLAGQAEGHLEERGAWKS